MHQRNWRSPALSLLFLGSTALLVAAEDQPAVPPVNGAPAANPAEPRKLVPPKELSESVTKGLKYLLAQQHENGGFGQGGGWRTSTGAGGRVEGPEVKDPPDVGNTCIAALALIRAGNSPKKGPYANQLTKAIEFIEKYVEEADKESMYVTPIRDSQLQHKIGQYVDTFLAALVLTELKGQMADPKSEERLAAALNKTVGKIEANQQADGTFAGNTGWASVLSQGLCSKAVNRAFQKGVRFKAETIKRDLDQSVAQLDPSSVKAADPVSTASLTDASSSGGSRIAAVGGLRGSSAKGDAGVMLYSLSSNAGRVQDAANSNQRKSAEARAVLASPTSDKLAKDTAQQQLNEVAESEAASREAVKQISSSISDARFIKGFGNNGGEEYLSYMNISETLFAQGGDEWTKWDRQVCELISKAQNEDGSWSGHHCITGRTFCTSAALLTMMADRVQLPVAEFKPETK